MEAGSQPLIIDPSNEALSYFCPQAARHGPAASRLDRFPSTVTTILQGRIGPLANLRSSSGCAICLRCDAPWIELRLQRLRHHQHAPVGIDLELIDDDGSRLVHSGDLREQEGAVSVRLPTGLERGGSAAECRIWLPLISTCAFAGLELPTGSLVEPQPAPSAT